MQSKLYYHWWSISKVINFPQAENQSDWSKCTYVCMIGKGKLHLDGLNQSNVSQSASKFDVNFFGIGSY
jgi:hypothetical protein